MTPLPYHPSDIQTKQVFHQAEPFEHCNMRAVLVKVLLALGLIAKPLIEALGLNLPTGQGYESLGGLIFSRMMTIPKDGSHPVVECYGLRIRAEEIVDRRVEWATVTILDQNKDSEEDKTEE